MTKRCTKCQQEKALDEFSPMKCGKFGRHPQCKACKRLLAKQHWQTNKYTILAKQKVRYHESKSWVKSKYNLSKAQFDSMAKACNGVCQICHNPPLRKSLSVDHNHKTGVVRGLLCEKCNLGIGCMLDDPTRLRAAADYLEAVPNPLV